jgi:hypothetical protein
LESIEGFLRKKGVAVQRGGACDYWDLEIQGGFWAGARLLMAVEDHGAGTQYVRCRVWPKCFAGGLALSIMLVVASAAAGFGGAWPVCVLLGVGALLSIYKTILDSGGASACMLQGIRVHDLQAAEPQSVRAHA